MKRERGGGRREKIKGGKKCFLTKVETSYHSYQQKYSYAGRHLESARLINENPDTCPCSEDRYKGTGDAQL